MAWGTVTVRLPLPALMKRGCFLPAAPQPLTTGFEPLHHSTGRLRSCGLALVPEALPLAWGACRRPWLVGGLTLVGVTLFSGSCYTVALQQERTWAKLAPIGCVGQGPGVT